MSWRSCWPAWPAHARRCDRYLDPPARTQHTHTCDCARAGRLGRRQHRGRGGEPVQGQRRHLGRVLPVGGRWAVRLEPRLHAQFVQVLVLGVVRLPGEEVSGLADVRGPAANTAPCGTQSAAPCGTRRSAHNRLWAQRCTPTLAHARTRTHSSTPARACFLCPRPAAQLLSTTDRAQRSPAPHRDKKFNCHSWGKAGECKSNAVCMKKHSNPRPLP